MRPVMSRLLCPLSYGPGTAHTLLRAVASAHIGGDTAPVRTLALLVVLAPALALADEIDLSRGIRRDRGEPAKFIVRAEAGNEFAPSGFAGGCVSWLIDQSDELDDGGGRWFRG